MSALVLVLALLVAPDEPPKPTAAVAAAGTKAIPRTSTSATTPASRTIVGEVVWVDFPSRLVLVRESVKSTPVKGKAPTRETIALAVAPDVPVIRGKQPSSFAELKPKDHVVARYVPTVEGARAVSLRVADATIVPRATSSSAPIPSGSALEAE